MFELIWWPFQLLFGLIGLVFRLLFGLIGGLFGLIFGLLGAVAGIAGLLFIPLIIYLIWRAGVRSGRKST